MRKKILKCSLMAVMATSLLTGCVSQEMTGADTKEQRIAATSVAVCNLLDALEVEGVVAVPETTSFEVPARYKDATSLGSPMSPDLEVLQSIKPTIVLSPKSLESELSEKYKNIGVKSAFINLSSVEGMYQSIKDLGTLFDQEENAKKLVSEYESYMDEYQKRNQSKESKTVLILMGLPGSYVVATEQSYVGNLVKLAGGVNVYGKGDGSDFINVNTEDMLLKKPDIILRTSHAMPEQVQAMFETEFEENDVWKNFEAVKNKSVYDLSHEYFGMSATFDYTKALEELEVILYN